MRKRSLVILVILLSVWTVSVGGAAESIGSVGRAAPLLRWMPPQTTGVVYVDWQTMMQNMTAGDPAMAGMMAAMGMQYSQLIGLNPMTEIDHVCVGFVGEIGQEGPKEVLTVVDGDFRQDRVIDALRRTTGPGGPSAMTTFRHGEHTVYRMQDLCLCFGERSTLLAGTESAVTTGLERAPKTKAELTTDLMSAIDAANYESGFWAAWDVAPWLTADLRDAEEGSPLAPWRPMHLVKSVSLSGREVGMEGMSFDLVSIARDRAAALELVTYLRENKARLLERTGVNVFYASLLQLTGLRIRGKQVSASLELTDSSLSRLWRTKMVLAPGAELPSQAEALPAEQLDETEMKRTSQKHPDAPAGPDGDAQLAALPAEGPRDPED